MERTIETEITGGGLDETATPGGTCPLFRGYRSWRVTAHSVTPRGTFPSSKSNDLNMDTAGIHGIDSNQAHCLTKRHRRALHNNPVVIVPAIHTQDMYSALHKRFSRADFAFLRTMRFRGLSLWSVVAASNCRAAHE